MRLFASYSWKLQLDFCELQVGTYIYKLPFIETSKQSSSKPSNSNDNGQFQVEFSTNQRAPFAGEEHAIVWNGLFQI